MTKVYVVMTGEYSEFTLHAIFTDPHVARLVADHIGGEVTEETLDPYVDEWRAGLRAYCVRIKVLTGEIISCRPSDSSYGSPEQWHACVLPSGLTEVKESHVYYTYVWATSKAEAIEEAKLRWQRRAITPTDVEET